MEPGCEYLSALRVPAIDSTAVPPDLRPALACKETLLPHEDLDNNVHPLFHFCNWVDLKWKHYQLMLPALRVATLLVQESALVHWWVHTLCGALRYTPLKGHYLESIHPSISDRAHKEILNVLKHSLPRVLRIGFSPMGVRGEQTDGMAIIFSQFCSSDQNVQLVSSEPRIILHSHYLWDLEYLQAHGTPDDLEHIQLRIAITLIHEVAHAVWIYRFTRNAKYKPEDVIKEPLHRWTDKFVELGYSWENLVFGGSIWAIDHPGHLTIYYTPPEIFEDPAAVRTNVVVPRWWIHMWFRKSTWEHFGPLHASGQLKLPTEKESGYVFKKHSPAPSPRWTLYIHGVKQDLDCMMRPYILWNIIRPRKEEEERIARDKITHRELPLVQRPKSTTAPAMP